MSEQTPSETLQKSKRVQLANALGKWWQDRMPKAVEDEWMVAHQKIVEQLEPGKAQEFFRKLKDIFRLYGRAQGISTLVADAVTAGIVGGLIAGTIPDKAKPAREAGLDFLTDFIDRTNKSLTLRRYYARQRAPWAIAGALSVLALGPTRALNRFAATMAGDHVGQIVNRMVGSPGPASVLVAQK